MAQESKVSHKRPEQPLLTILIPVYNEEKTIEKILKQTTSLPIDRYEVLVVDDASKDASKQLIEAFAAKFSSKKVSLNMHAHAKNRGKGGGIQTGIKNATGEYFIIQDADLEYDPKDIPPMLNLALKNNYPVVYGSRFKGSVSGMAMPNYLANRFYNFFLRRLYRTSITDMHTCYKMVRTDVMRDLKMSSEGFDYATELVSKLLKRGYVIEEAPISFHGRTKQEGKKIGLMDGWECLYMLVKYKLRRTL